MERPGTPLEQFLVTFEIRNHPELYEFDLSTSRYGHRMTQPKMESRKINDFAVTN